MPSSGSTLPASRGIGIFGYIDAHHRRGFRLRLKDPAGLAAAMPDASEAHRTLDAAILETLLRGTRSG